MDLGQFSVSLAVKDLDASLDFYGKLGFDVIDGGSEVVWIGVPSASPAEVKAEHDRWVKECRSGEFKFFEED